MRFFIVDAFTEDVFGGNPAGVVLFENNTEYPPDETLLKTAAELRYSETAFLKPLPDGTLQIRYFTPAAEVDFCGHATIASFTALLHAGFAKRNAAYPIHTLSGDLEIKITSDFIMMEMPSPKLLKKIENPAEITELYDALGITVKPVAAFAGTASVSLLPILISTGFPDIFLPVKDLPTLAAISPDFAALSALTEKHGSGGAHAFTLDSATPGITACCRNFAPLFGIDEEAATGTASGGLTYYLYHYGIIKDGDVCCFLQGEAMGRPSKIITSVCASDGVNVLVGGKGAVLAEGEIYL